MWPGRYTSFDQAFATSQGSVFRYHPAEDTPSSSSLRLQATAQSHRPQPLLQCFHNELLGVLRVSDPASCLRDALPDVSPLFAVSVLPSCLLYTCLKRQEGRFWVPVLKMVWSRMGIRLLPVGHMNEAVNDARV
ncbi:unnamed protein product [Rangifer tarandus platyrhynchus]|uniref:Uncharacterized protein n=1 Tax=Rangifer tarandus platyrhynchus TaxID=3082113 RepID=A0ABN8Z0J8_RANTA|nr:unnamed protein product [Rangifer tarandus platyrhynchus]